MADNIAQLIRCQNQALGKQLVLGPAQVVLMDCTTAKDAGKEVMAKQIARMFPSVHLDDEEPLQTAFLLSLLSLKSS